MLKPIKPKKYIAGDTGLKFARKILERKAQEGLYDFSETELVFALGKSAEQDNILSVLELLDTLLDALKNGIGFRGGRSIFVYARGVLNLAENILQRGGVSEEYRCAVDVYNALREKLNSFSERKSTEEFDSLKEKLTAAINSIKSSKTERLTEIKSRTKRTDSVKTDVISTAAFGAASVGVLRMTARNPELFKSVRSNRTFLELALKCEEKQRRGFKLRRRFSMLADELSERQTEFLRSFILENGLFSKTLEAGGNIDELNNSKSVLEFIANNSSYNELEKFFSTFERRLSIERQSERHYSAENKTAFSSVEEMRKFFTSADIPQLESFAEYLKANSAQEYDIMQKALDEYISLTRGLSELLQRTVEMIGQNAEFSDYSREKLFENEKFAGIYSEFNASSKENVTEKIYAENSDFVLSYGEYTLNRVRESGDVGEEFRKTAEKIERILYYEQSESTLKADEIREIISTADSGALKEFAKMLEEFTRTDRLSITTRALYEYIDRFALNERLSEAEKLLKQVVRYNSDADALAGEIERFAENNSSFSFWSVLERSADKLTGLYSVNNRTFERFSEWLENQLSDSKTSELIKAYSETHGLSESFERMISEINSETMSAEEYEKAYSEFTDRAENILAMIENSESTLEEIYEKLERLTEKDFADRAEIISEVEQVFSALEEKGQLTGEISELIKLQLTENSSTNVEDLKLAIKNIVSTLEEKGQLTSELSELLKLQLTENSSTSVEDLKLTIKNIVSALEEKEQLSSEISGLLKLQLTESSGTSVEDLKLTIKNIVSALEEKGQLTGELSELLKLQLTENSSTSVEDLKLTVKNIVSALEEKGQLSSEISELIKLQLTENSSTNIEDLKLTVKNIVSALVDKGQLTSELSELIKLQLTESSSTSVEDLKLTVKNIVSALEEKGQLTSEISELIKLQLTENSSTSVEDLKLTVKNIVSALEENGQLTSELSELLKLQLTENSSTSVEDLKLTVKNIVSALEEKEQLSSELSELLKLQLTENSSTSVEDLKLTIKNIVSALKQKEIENRESNFNNNEISKRRFTELFSQSENFSDMYEGDLEFISKTLEYLKISENDYGKKDFSEISREVNYVLDNINRVEYTLPKSLELISSLIEKFKLSETESSKIAVTEELVHNLEEPMIRLYADSAVLSEFVRISREFQNGKVKTSEIEREYESLLDSLMSSYRSNTVNFEELKLEFKNLSSSYSKMTESERLRAFEWFSEQLSLCNSQGMIGGEKFSDVLMSAERINLINKENFLKFADERTNGISTVYYQLSKLLNNVKTAIDENNRGHLTELLRDFDETFSSDKISENIVLSEVKKILSNVEEYSDNEFEKPIENMRLVYVQSLIRSKLNAEKETVNSLKAELEELKTDFYQKTENNSERIERFTENVLRLFNSVKSESYNGNETAEFKRLSEYLETQDFARSKFTRELFEAITDDVTEERLNSALFADELVMNNSTANVVSSEKIADEIIKAIAYDETAESISKTLNDIKNVFGTAVFGIKQINSKAKSVAADKTLYKAVKNFYGENTDELAEFIEQKAYDYDLFYLRKGDKSEVLQENKLFRFSHDAVSRLIRNAGHELVIQTAKAANSPYERIYSQLEKQNERADYSGAELFYTEEYFESPRENVTVNYAVNASGVQKSEEVSERLSGLSGKLDNITREIAEVRKNEQEMSTRFVLKSESSILEREIKSSIERDILLAGKRHGIF